MAPRAGKHKGKTGDVVKLRPTVSAADAPHMSEDEFREALYRRLIAQHRAYDAELAKIESAAKARKKQRTAVRNQLKQGGFFLSNVDNILKTSAKSADRREEQTVVDQLAWMRELEGLPVARTGEQLDLYERMPVTEKDRLEWINDGFHNGICDNVKALPAGCPAVFHQDWLKAYDDGAERRRWAEAQVINPDRVASDVAPPPKPADCETCGGDGTGLEADVTVCPTCGAEYEPPDPAEIPPTTAGGAIAKYFDGDPETYEPIPDEAPAPKTEPVH